MHTLPGDSSLANEPVHRSNITTESLFLISLRNPRDGKKREGKSVAVAAVRLENKSLISGNHFISYANGKNLSRSLYNSTIYSDTGSKKSAKSVFI